MRRCILRLLNAFRPGAAEDELAREVRAHLAMLEDEHRRRGLSPDEARLAARRAIGSVALVHDNARDAGSLRWVDDLLRDGRHAVRRLRQAPGFAAAAILTLGLGVAVNNTFFTIVNAICLRGLPIEAPERVLTLGTRDAQGRPGSMSWAEFDDLHSVQKSSAGMAAYTNAPVTLADDGRAADRAMGAHISAAGFDLLGELPILGRGFRPEDDQPGAPAVVIIGAGVGIAPTIRQRLGGIGPDPVVYLPHRSLPSANAAIMVRETREPTRLTPAVREELRRLDPNLPLYRVMSLQQAMDESAWNPRMASLVAENIAAIALLMALIGLYAVTAHAVHLWKPS